MYVCMGCGTVNADGEDDCPVCGHGRYQHYEDYAG